MPMRCLVNLIDGSKKEVTADADGTLEKKAVPNLMAHCTMQCAQPNGRLDEMLGAGGGSAKGWGLK
jgi:hypothetical protein